MTSASDKAEQVFWDALQLGSEQERRAHLDKACGGDQQLRHLVEKLLRAQPKVAAFLEQPFTEPQAASAAPIHEGPGTLIGPYKLLEQIGEGGFGVVFMAEQTGPVRRKVALKILKPGMDTRQVVARFEAERQALAIMDHPNIAKVFDGGATVSGRPYFAMELAKGVPITEFCDQNHLPPRRRLELFLPVCQAVQHAHQKGIIHRDLKPSNVLVSRHDTTPVVKVIDFGVAKAVGQTLTDKTLLTGVAQMIGTPLYMSPEQAGMSDLDVDTRSDIYSLGMLLYELLTGTTPFDKERFKQCSYDEIRRIISEEEPARPSTRLSTLGQAAATVSANRESDPRALSRLFRGELDWIVMKCLEKDRDRRYETANDFAADVQRYLYDEPVLACPPSAGYRLRKFARRNKAVLAAVAVITLAVLTAVTALAVSNVRITWEKKEKELAWQKAAENGRRAREAVKKYLTEISEDPELQSRGLETVRRKLLESARDYYAQFVEDARADRALRVDLADAHTRLGLIAETLGDKEQALKEFQAALGLYRQLAAAVPNDNAIQRMLIVSHGSLGRVFITVGRLRDAEAELEAIAMLMRSAGSSADAFSLFHLARTYTDLGSVYVHTSRPREAEAAYQQAIDLWQRLLQHHPKQPRYLASLATTQSNLGNLFQTTGRLPQAEQAHVAAVELHRALVRNHRAVTDFQDDLAGSLLNLGALYEKTGRLRDTEKASDEARAIWQRLADLYPNVVMYRHNLAGSFNNLANVYSRTGRPKEAGAAYQQAYSILRELVKAHGGDVNDVIALGGVQCNFGDQALKARKAATALEWYDQAISTLEGALRREARDPTARQYLLNAQYARANSLRLLGRHVEAVAAFRETIRLDPDLAEAHCNLGHALKKLGRFREGLAALRRGHELGAKKPGWHYPSADWVRDAETLLRWDEELAALQRGEPPPAGVVERAALAKFCVAHKKLNLTGLRLWEGVFADKPELADHDKGPHLYHAACAAALTGSGQGRDVAGVDNRERARLRRQALDWLRPALGLWTARVNQGTAAERAAIQTRLRHWQTDSDLAGIRDQAALAKLPAAERETWRTFWAELAALLARADALNQDAAKSVPPKKSPRSGLKRPPPAGLAPASR
jgi:serine/threonine protein kinase/tetratricopeptide (TPR) repeat protein